MSEKLVEAGLFLSSTLLGAHIGYHVYGLTPSASLWLVIGLLFGIVLISVFRGLLRTKADQIVGGAIGLLVASLLALIFFHMLAWTNIRSEIDWALRVYILFILCLTGVRLGSFKAKDYSRARDKRGGAPKVVGIVDTSVIIDGRIADLCETGFLEGDLIIPQFVLHELQMIADSSDSLKRTRGRRGLDILNKIPNQPYVNIIIDESDAPEIQEVDQKLIARAKQTGYPILTNDYNLNKVADVHSVQVLNINQLANALKPIVLPGESIRVKVIKEGKEHDQGIAYLDDGTMVVIDRGRRHKGKLIEVTVTSVLQTSAGRMIFAETP
jgi:uncharacterized protein YacL